ncbi:Hypothetical predicted protein [Prunus dulcis]|uniref:Retrotransposon gag domain-containing protein n=1 Tax=Prunus dulcis TaxID=3755 RepID=A0A5E4GDE6_PRUDU|nr:Hypothetical predicted protein [Prunus dulcis]
MTKIKVPEPKAYVGERSAKKLTNFVWDMEQYFKATKVSNAERVFITSMYLAEPSMDSLKTLKQVGVVRDYVKTFCSLMLDVSNMSKEDKLFNFLMNLQSWAQSKLRRQDVGDLNSSIATVDRLMDYCAAVT